MKEIRINIKKILTKKVMDNIMLTRTKANLKIKRTLMEKVLLKIMSHFKTSISIRIIAIVSKK